MKNRKLLVIGLVTIIAIIAIAIIIFSSSASNQQVDAIRAAVFRYQMQQDSSGVYCLSVSNTGQNPSSELLAQLKNDESTIKKYSDCASEPAVVLSIDKVWTGPDIAQVQGHTYTGSYSAYAYTVKQQSGQWVVTQASPLKVGF